MTAKRASTRDAGATGDAAAHTSAVVPVMIAPRVILHHEGRRYRAGDTLEATAQEATRLAEAGLILGPGGQPSGSDQLSPAPRDAKRRRAR